MSSTTSIISLEVFEQKAIEAKQLLYTSYVELKKFREENPYKRMDKINFYAWQTNQERLIDSKSYNCGTYLRYFSVGDFDGCERILSQGFYVEPKLMDEELKTE